MKKNDKNKWGKNQGPHEPMRKNHCLNSASTSNSHVNTHIPNCLYHPDNGINGLKSAREKNVTTKKSTPPYRRRCRRFVTKLQLHTRRQRHRCHLLDRQLLLPAVASIILALGGIAAKDVLLTIAFHVIVQTLLGVGLNRGDAEEFPGGFGLSERCGNLALPKKTIL